MVPGTNQRGRYALHFHRNGADDTVTDQTIFAEAVGNVIWGSPGWGIVHHDGFVNIIDNVVFDVLGAGIVAERGNEVGTWRNNLVIKVTGDEREAEDFDPVGTADKERTLRFDFGFNGEAYWVQGSPGMSLIDNIAVSAAGSGVNVFSGVDAIKKVYFNTHNVTDVALRDALLTHGGDDQYPSVHHLPMPRFDGQIVYNSDVGIITWGHMRNQNNEWKFTATSGATTGIAHTGRTKINDFRLWNIWGEGIFTQYSSQVDFNNGLILGDRDNPIPFKSGINGSARGTGVNSNNPAIDIRYNGLRIEGWGHGLTANPENSEIFNNAILNSTLANNTWHMVSIENSWTFSDYGDLFVIDHVSFDPVVNDSLPIASFVTSSLGGLGILLDATASFDHELPPYHASDARGIVAYGWDLDNDGQLDAWDRQLAYTFDQPGNHDVTLVVWDSQGQTTTLTQTITVTAEPYGNAFGNGHFDVTEAFGTSAWNAGSLRRDDGWFQRGFVRNPLGFTESVPDQFNFHGLAQVVRDEYIHRGQQTLSLDLKHVIGSNNNDLVIALYGLNDQWRGSGERNKDPEQLEARPLDSTTIFKHNLGDIEFNDWTPVQWQVDLGDGFEYLFFRITTNQFDVNSGDYVAVDNISLENSTFGNPKTIGDVNHDGQVNGLDVDPFVKQVISGMYDFSADTNRDGAVNGLDIDSFTKIILGHDPNNQSPDSNNRPSTFDNFSSQSADHNADEIEEEDTGYMIPMNPTGHLLGNNEI